MNFENTSNKLNIETKSRLADLKLNTETGKYMNILQNRRQHDIIGDENHALLVCLK